MTRWKSQLLLFVLASPLFVAAALVAQQPSTMDVEHTQQWSPVPPVVTPGATNAAPPSDAIVLFDGTNLDQWVSAQDGSPAKWFVSAGVMTVNKTPGVGNIQTRRTFKNYQLHIEWKIPKDITGSGQLRGNSGVILASTGPGNDGFELQILDSYKNPTYVNGQAGAIYMQHPPLVNASRKPGEWQTYDVVWTAPAFKEDGSLKKPAYVTVFFNGVVVQIHYQLEGQTSMNGFGTYKKYDRAPIKLQAHKDKSEPVSFRNIWVRELPYDVRARQAICKVSGVNAPCGDPVRSREPLIGRSASLR